MLVMPANMTGWFFHSLARETSKLGHLYSPGAQRTPCPWFPYALDNGAYSCWDKNTNTFNHDKWDNGMLDNWKRLIVWAQCQNQKPMWAIVPDVIGDKSKTFERYNEYVKIVQEARIPVALAVQDGMCSDDVINLKHQPDVIAVGGTDEFKWGTVRQWVKDFSKVHVLRCNIPEKLYELESMGVISCDGTGWNRGNITQTKGLERWAYSTGQHTKINPSEYIGKHTKKSEENQITFA
tara:strand:+ start:342 stop:1052 length:711 start_codon:yes stop_codon:yes gene_type:complete